MIVGKRKRGSIVGEVFQSGRVIVSDRESSFLDLIRGMFHHIPIALENVKRRDVLDSQWQQANVGDHVAATDVQHLNTREVATKAGCLPRYEGHVRLNPAL